MKSIRLISNFFNQNKLPTIVLLIIYTLVIFFFTITYGQYRHITYTGNLFANMQDTNFVYCMPNIDLENSISNEGDFVEGEFNKLEEKAKTYSAYKPFVKTQNLNIEYNGKQSYGYIYDSFVSKNMQLNLSQGTWFDKQPAQTDGSFNVIVSGTGFSSVSVGQKLAVNLVDYKTSAQVTVNVIGKLASPYVGPMFNSGGSTVNTEGLFATYSGIIFEQSDKLKSKLAEENIVTNTAHSFIAPYNSGATEQEKSEYLEFLQNNSLTNTYDDIVKNTNSSAQMRLERSMPMPIFFLIIITLSLICTSALFMSKKFSEYAVYYLCGCSRKRSFTYMLCGISLISFVGGLINIVFCMVYPYLVDYNILNLYDTIIDQHSLICIVIYTAVAIILSTVIPFIIFRKNTPIEAYRRFDT